MRRLLKILKTTFCWLAEAALENVEVLQTKVKFFTALLQDSKVLCERERERERERDFYKRTQIFMFYYYTSGRFVD
jgi:hypothetical protein